ncbi:unnamed protein product [Lactuca saligna]|uniref:Uncharacterized protein n=1 Tax=Lactuca saligna TaxID=75948 RepID=A0AA35YUJ3_LACSI|nr:unnamed protein product [Lactuca saligna]
MIVSINQKKFGNVLRRRYQPDPIIKVIRTKPKNKCLKLHMVKEKAEDEDIEVIFARELVKYGYNEWIQIQEIISKHKGIHAQEVKLAIETLINKVKKLNLVPSVGPSQPSTSERTSKPKISKSTKFLLPYGTRYINNKKSVGIEPIQHMFIWELEHGIFYLASQNQMCFQHIEDLLDAPIEHLFNLHLEGMRHKYMEIGYCVLISFKLNKHLTDLHLDDSKWLKPEILTKAEKFSNDDLTDFVED